MKKSIEKILVISVSVFAWLILIVSIFVLYIISPLFQELVSGYALPVLLLCLCGGLAIISWCRRRVASIFSLGFPIVILVIVGAFLVGYRGYMSHFSPLKWQLHKEARYVMVEDLKKNYLPIGSSQETATKLLGVENEFDSEFGKEGTKVTVRTYLIAPGIIDPTVMQVCLSNGKVISILTYQS